MSQHCMQANNMHFTVIILTGHVGIGCEKLSSVPKLAKMFTCLSLMKEDRPTPYTKGAAGKDCPNCRDFKWRNIIEVGLPASGRARNTGKLSSGTK